MRPGGVAAARAPGERAPRPGGPSSARDHRVGHQGIHAAQPAAIPTWPTFYAAAGRSWAAPVGPRPALGWRRWAPRASGRRGRAAPRARIKASPGRAPGRRCCRSRALRCSEPCRRRTASLRGEPFCAAAAPDALARGPAGRGVRVWGGAGRARVPVTGWVCRSGQPRGCDEAAGARPADGAAQAGRGRRRGRAGRGRRRQGRHRSSCAARAAPQRRPPPSLTMALPHLNTVTVTHHGNGGLHAARQAHRRCSPYHKRVANTQASEITNSSRPGQAGGFMVHAPTSTPAAPPLSAAGTAGTGRRPCAPAPPRRRSRCSGARSRRASAP